MTPRSLSAAVIAVGMAMSLVVAVATPPWEANDEPDHVRNVQTLVDGRWYRMTPDAGMEAHQPPLYYLLLAGWQRYLLRLGPWPVHPAPGAWALGHRHDIATDGADQRLVTLLRLMSVLLGGVTAALTWRAVDLLGADRWTPAVAAAFVYGVPKFVFLAGVVNNDNLANALGAAILVVTATSLRRRDGGSAALLGASGGALTGLLLLTKVTAVLLAPAVVLGLWIGGSTARARAVRLASFVAAALAVSGWWLASNTLLYGDPLATASARAHLESISRLLFRVGPPARQAFVEIPSTVFWSFWYVSGHNQLLWAGPYRYAALWLGLAVGVVGLFRRGVPLAVPRGTVAVLGVAVLGGAAAIWVVGMEAISVQARIGFFALPALGALYALGVQRWQLAVPLRFALPAAGLALTWLAIVHHVIGFFPGW